MKREHYLSIHRVQLLEVSFGVSEAIVALQQLLLNLVLVLSNDSGKLFVLALYIQTASYYRKHL